MARLETEVLIIGTGIAGATCALIAAQQGLMVTLVTKRNDPHRTNTNRAQGGIVFRGKEDSPEMLKEDILRAGRDINSVEAVDFISEKGPDVVEEVLIRNLHVDFSHLTDSYEDNYDLTREGAHSVNRILYSADNTGEVIEKSLIKAVSSHENVTIITGATAIDLVTMHHHSSDIQARYMLGDGWKSM
jgi:L-aspartate oxidase